MERKVLPVDAGDQQGSGGGAPPDRGFWVLTSGSSADFLVASLGLDREDPTEVREAPGLGWLVRMPQPASPEWVAALQARNWWLLPVEGVEFFGVPVVVTQLSASAVPGPVSGAEGKD